MTSEPAPNTPGDPRMNATSAAAMAALVAQLRPSPKDRTVAVLLALFLGFIGAHKFYLGQPGWGVLYVLFSWTMIPFLAGLVEAVIYLVMGEYEFRARYG